MGSDYSDWRAGTRVIKIFASEVSFRQFCEITWHFKSQESKTNSFPERSNTPSGQKHTTLSCSTVVAVQMCSSSTSPGSSCFILTLEAPGCIGQSYGQLLWSKHGGGPWRVIHFFPQQGVGCYKSEYLLEARTLAPVVSRSEEVLVMTGRVISTHAAAASWSIVQDLPVNMDSIVKSFFIT